jgi:hypothetical protein
MPKHKDKMLHFNKTVKMDEVQEIEANDPLLSNPNIHHNYKSLS